MTTPRPRTTPVPVDPDVVELREGRVPKQLPRTEIFDWVALAVHPSTGKPIRGEAVKLYDLIKMHVNRRRGDSKVFTSTLSLAKLMGMSRGDKIGPYVKELAEIQAIDVIRGGMYRRNTYVVHTLPPDNYTGIVDLGMWYRVHKRELDAAREREKQVRDARRHGAGTGPVTPDSGEQPVTPDSGSHVTPDSGLLVTPDSGRKPSSGFEPPVNEPPPPSGSSGPDQGPPPDWAVPGQEREQENDPDSPQHTPTPTATPAYPGLSVEEAVLHAEMVTARPDWHPDTIGEVLADPRIRGRGNRALVTAAFRRAAAEPRTSSPRRLLHDVCPHWAQAARDLYGDLGAAPDPSGARARQQFAVWCGSPWCDQTTRQLLTDEGHPKVDGNGWVWCPVCSPYRVPDPDPAGGLR